MFDNNRDIFDNDSPYLPFPYLVGEKPHRFNLKELIKNHALKLLWGRGFTLHGKDRKKIEEIFEAARADTFFPALEGVLFEQGHGIIVIRKTLGGELRISAPLL